MKILSMLLLSLCLINCAETSKGVVFHDPALAPYLASFLVEANLRGVKLSTNNLTLKIEDVVCPLNPGAVGCCSVTKDSLTVRIKTSFFYNKYISDLGKEQVIFHELSHCLLNKKHNDSLEEGFSGTIPSFTVILPSSIMSSWYISEEVYENNREEYLNRLFLGYKTVGLVWQK